MAAGKRIAAHVRFACQGDVDAAIQALNGMKLRVEGRAASIVAKQHIPNAEVRREMFLSAFHIANTGRPWHVLLGHRRE